MGWAPRNEKVNFNDFMQWTCMNQKFWHRGWDGGVEVGWVFVGSFQDGLVAVTPRIAQGSDVACDGAVAKRNQDFCSARTFFSIASCSSFATAPSMSVTSTFSGNSFTSAIGL